MTRLEHIKAIKDILPIIEKYDGKVFGKLFEKDIKKIYPDAWISNHIGLQYIYLTKEDRIFIGWDKKPIDFQRLNIDLNKQIESMLETQNQIDSENKKMKQIEAKFFKLTELIHELDDLSFENKDKLKKQFDIDFKTYYRG